MRVPSAGAARALASIFDSPDGLGAFPVAAPNTSLRSEAVSQLPRVAEEPASYSVRTEDGARAGGGTVTTGDDEEPTSK
jgi:hypothetical protein